MTLKVADVGMHLNDRYHLVHLVCHSCADVVLTRPRCPTVGT